jgi:hypothetical protein
VTKVVVGPAAFVERLWSLRDELASFEPGVYETDSCARLAEALSSAARACDAAALRAAARASDAGEHRQRGFTDARDWIAAMAGSTTSEARDALHTINAIEDTPETRDAVRAGEVSLRQAAEIARADAEAPGCEAELLELAKGGSLGPVRERARARRLEVIDRDELHAKQHSARSFKHWRDGMGMVCGTFALTPDVGVPLVNRIMAETDRLHRAARRAGTEEPRAAFAADAVVRVCNGEASPWGGVVANIVIDWPALVRGHVHPGERSHIVGGGPIPPRVVRSMMENAFLKLVLTDGVEVQRVAHVGRHIPAELRTALELGPPPAFEGVTCSELGCDRRYGLEWDHKDPIANGGVTSLANLQPLCGPDHWEKTDCDRAAGLLGASKRAPP